MLNSKIVDGKGRGHLLTVSKEGKLCVQEATAPPSVEDDIALPFRQKFTTTGDSSGSSDMKVNGATTNVDFYIAADDSYDIYVKNASVVIADAGATLNKFGNISALTNGVRFYWSNQSVGEIEIHEGIKTNFQFVRLGLGSPAFGTTTSSFRASNVSGSSEAFLPNIDMAATFGLPWGVRLRAGSTDKLVFTVRDNVSGVDQFDITGYGISVKRK